MGRAQAKGQRNRRTRFQWGREVTSDIQGEKGTVYQQDASKKSCVYSPRVHVCGRGQVRLNYTTSADERTFFAYGLAATLAPAAGAAEAGVALACVADAEDVDGVGAGVGAAAAGVGGAGAVSDVVVVTGTHSLLALLWYKRPSADAAHPQYLHFCASKASKPSSNH